MGYCHKECANQYLRISLICKTCNTPFEGIVTRRVVDVRRQVYVVLAYLLCVVCLSVYGLTYLTIIILSLQGIHLIVQLSLCLVVIFGCTLLITLGAAGVDEVLGTVISFLIRLRWIDEYSYTVEEGIRFI